MMRFVCRIIPSSRHARLDPLTSLAGRAVGLTAFFVLRALRPQQASVRYLFGIATLAAMLVAPISTFMSLADDVMTPSASVSWRPPSQRISGGLVTGSHHCVPVPAIPRRSFRQLIPPGPGIARTPNRTSHRSGFRSSPSSGCWVSLSLLAASARRVNFLTRSLTRRAVVAVAPAIDAAARESAKRLELHRGVAILELSRSLGSLVVGWCRPPSFCCRPRRSPVSRPRQLRAILAHELAHVRRHDYLVDLLHRWSKRFFFYHPAVWWISAQVRSEREHCCDDLAVEVCGDRSAYVALAELTSMERRAFALGRTQFPQGPQDFELGVGRSRQMS